MADEMSKKTEYQNVTEVAGPLMVVEGISDVAYDEIAKVKLPSGEERLGQVLEAGTDSAVLQVFAGTRGLDTKETSVQFTGEVMKFGVSRELLGRVFNGVGEPIDGSPDIIPDERRNING
ncbi:MAG: V-type ATP synthase subunit B, partial [Candidatus Thermoplasmatota archaeon]